MLLDIYSELCGVLNRVDTECENTRSQISLFEEYAGAYLADRLSRKLTIIREWVSTRINQLKQEHGDTGYICIFLNDTEGIIPIWVETKTLVGNKSWYLRFGNTVLSIEEFIDIIEQLDDALTVNEWQKVVDWLNKYGRPLALDSTKLPEA